MTAPYTGLQEIDWTDWIPHWRATLLFISRAREVVLIHKKRGFGKGKINGPGGRIEAGETPKQAAIREVQEEICVTPTGVEEYGELFFQFQDGFSIHGVVFLADGFEGDLGETEEAAPFWVSHDEIPYARMWADDVHWLPLVLAGQRFTGRFLFDGEVMLEHHIEEHSSRLTWSDRRFHLDLHHQETKKSDGLHS